MQPIIQKVDYFACGTCTNHLNWMFKGGEKKQLTFPAGVFLIKHRTEGYILYDTGYTTELKRNKFKYSLYRFVTPIQLEKEQMIDQQLHAKGIRAEEIRWIILSHLHPDHIGAVKQFPQARFILTEAAMQNYRKNTVKDLIFKELLPKDFESRVVELSTNESNSSFLYKNVSDIFADGSLLLSSFDGHAKGQGCLYISEKNLFLAADIVWGIDLLPFSRRIKSIPGWIQNSLDAYFESLEKLQEIQQAGIKVIVSHDPETRVREVLDE
ncbi:MBL fold metallo-hydrolase [Enterococcus olivae]